jgi:hypothetical protein
MCRSAGTKTGRVGGGPGGSASGQVVSYSAGVQDLSASARARTGCRREATERSLHPILCFSRGISPAIVSLASRDLVMRTHGSRTDDGAEAPRPNDMVQGSTLQTSQFSSCHLHRNSTCISRAALGGTLPTKPTKPTEPPHATSLASS